MPEQKLDQTPGDDDGRQTLKKTIIVFAIVEALVLIPIIVYTIFR